LIEAKQFCAEKGMNLAIIETEQELKNLWGADPKKGEYRKLLEI